MCYAISGLAAQSCGWTVISGFWDAQHNLEIALLFSPLFSFTCDPTLSPSFNPISSPNTSPRPSVHLTFLMTLSTDYQSPLPAPLASLKARGDPPFPIWKTIVCILIPAPLYPCSQARKGGEGAWFQQSAHGTYRFNHVLFSGRVAVTPLKSRSWLYDIAIHRIKLASLSSFCLSALANTLVLLLNKDLYHKKADGCAMEAQVTLFHQ